MISYITFIDSHKYYREHTRSKGRVAVDSVTYLRILSGFAEFLMKKMLDGFLIQLSAGNTLGTLGVRGIRPKIRKNENGEPIIEGNGRIRGLTVDWVNTKKLWESNKEAKQKGDLVYFTNDHTNGLKYNIVWWQKGMDIGHRVYYSFKPSKNVKRALCKRLKEGKEYLTENY